MLTDTLRGSKVRGAWWLGRFFLVLDCWEFYLHTGILMGNAVTKARCVFQRTLIVPVVRAAVREKHVRLRMLFIFLYLLRIHFSDHHCPVLIAVTITVQGHYSIGCTCLADPKIRHDPAIMINVIITVNNFTYTFELFWLHGRMIRPWKPTVIFGTPRAHLTSDEVAIYLFPSCGLTAHFSLLISRYCLKHLSCLIINVPIIDSQCTCSSKVVIVGATV